MARIKYYDSVAQEWAYADMAVAMPPSRLPSGYQEVEYIESTGTQYIDTGIYTNGNMSACLDIEISSRRIDWGVTFGAWEDDKLFGFTVTDTDNKIQIIHGSTSATYKTFTYGKRQKIFITPTYAVWNEASQTYSLKNYEGTTTKIKLFTGTNAKCYYCEICEAGVPVRKLIPCYRIADDEIGMYDIVNDVFYTNAGTGTFIKGADV